MKVETMSKVIPILPCANINEQCGFYESIGFTATAKYTAPNAYAVVQFDDITLHFWGSRKHIPEHNASCVFIEVGDVDAINELFCANIKKATGKVPRAGFGRITQTRSLKEDRRFTLCDPAGNTIYIGTPQTDCPDRTLTSSQHAKAFAMAYDLLHSHESPEKAAKTLPKLQVIKSQVGSLDREKIEMLITKIEESIQ
jgi:hypothetical protein